MNKELSVKINNGEIQILMNQIKISSFEISKNKINGKELFNNLDVKKEDKFTLLPHNLEVDTKNADELLIIHTHSFLEKVVTRINDILKDINTQN